MPLKLKLDNKQSPVIIDEKVVYIETETGKELPLDPPNMYAKILELNKESKSHREGKEALESKFKIFEGVTDLTAWHKEATDAIQTVKNFKEKDWLDAEKVEKMKSEMKVAHEEQLIQVKKSYDVKLGEVGTVIKKKDAQLYQLVVSNKFATSPLFSGTNPKTTLPPEIAETYFGKHFKVEEDPKTGKLKVTAYYNSDDIVYSHKNPGDPADFDEALELIFDQYSGKDKLLRSTGGGSGGQGGSGNGGNTDDEITALERQHAEALNKKDAKLAITLKSRLFEARRKKQAGR